MEALLPIYILCWTRWCQHSGLWAMSIINDFINNMYIIVSISSNFEKLAGSYMMLLFWWLINEKCDRQNEVVIVMVMVLCIGEEKSRTQDGTKNEMGTLEISQLSKWLEMLEHSLECPGRGGGGRRNSGGAGGGRGANFGGPGPVTRWASSNITRCWSSTYSS